MNVFRAILKFEDYPADPTPKPKKKSKDKDNDRFYGGGGKGYGGSTDLAIRTALLAASIGG